MPELEASRLLTLPERMGSALVVIWAIALLALVAVGVTSSSGPVIATSLIVMAVAPVVLVLVIGYSAARQRHI